MGQDASKTPNSAVKTEGSGTVPPETPTKESPVFSPPGQIKKVPTIDGTEKREQEMKDGEGAQAKKPKRLVGVAVIGTGQRMVTLLRQLLLRHPDAVVIRAFCDPAPESTTACVDRLLVATGLEYLKTVPVFTDHKQLLMADIDFEWVMIGSKNSLHRDHCVHSFIKGKHVFCEKPMATTIDHCIAIRKAHQQSGKLFATGFVLRHAPFYVKLHQLLQQKLIGDVISLEANETLAPGHGGYIMRNWRRHRKDTGPHLLEKCCHDIDILNWLMESVPSRVASFGGLSIFTPKHKPTDRETHQLYFTWPAWEDVDPFESEKDTEDHQVAIMEYRNGVKATFHTNCNTSMPERSVRIFGTKGTIYADLLKGKIKYRLISPEGKKEKIEFGERGMHGGADETIMDDLVESMQEGSQPKAGGQEGFLSALVCLGIDQARVEGKVVDMEEIWKQFGV